MRAPRPRAGRAGPGRGSDSAARRRAAAARVPGRGPCSAGTGAAASPRPKTRQRGPPRARWIAAPGTPALRLDGVIRRLDLRGQTLRSRALRGVVPRAALDVEHAVERVRPLCEDVRVRGVDALLDLTERFDGVRPAGIRVPVDALARALEVLDADVRTGLEESIRRVRLVHRGQLPTGSTTTVVPGGTVTQRWVPVGRVGLY